jgi:lysophospholipase L1-like esterase
MKSMRTCALIFATALVGCNELPDVPTPIATASAAPKETASDAGDHADSGVPADAGSTGVDAARGHTGQVPPPPGTPDLTPGTWRIEGRYVSDPAGPKLTWAGSAMTFRFQGSSVTITYKDDTLYGKTGCNWYDVIMDGAPMPPVPLIGHYPSILHDPGTYTWTINVPAGTPQNLVHEVTIAKRTEEEHGSTQILGFDKTLLLLPADTRTRKMEFIGDSLTVGFGVEGNITDDPLSTETFNERRAYPALVAEHFKAERHTIAASGRGLVRDATGDTSYNGNMSDRWLRVQEGGSIVHSGGTAPTYLTALWDFSTWQADVVTVNLGTNDYVAAQTSIRSAFATFYRLVRKSYPHARIIGIMPSQPTGTVRTALRSDIQGAIADVADPKLSFFEFPEADPADGQGGAGHPNTITARKQSLLLIAEVQRVTGWQ